MRIYIHIHEEYDESGCSSKVVGRQDMTDLCQGGGDNETQPYFWKKFKISCVCVLLFLAPTGSNCKGTNPKPSGLF